MTTHEDDNEPEPPIVEQALAEAQSLVKALANYLQANGWDAIVLSLTRVIEVAPGDFRAPGATATVLDKGKVGPVTSQIADVLHKQADMLGSHAEGEVTSGYIQDQSDHASGLREWPR